MGLFGNGQQNSGSLNLGVGQPGQMPIQGQNPFAPQNGMMQQASQNPFTGIMGGAGMQQGMMGQPMMPPSKRILRWL